MSKSVRINTEHTKKILKLFRNLLRERLGLPTENRREYILIKTRQEFRKAKNETDPKKLRSLTIIGNTQLDTVIVQAKHLSSILEREPTEFEQRNNLSYEEFKKDKSTDNHKTFLTTPDFKKRIKTIRNIEDDIN
ncbi:hypothetical protein RB653_006315 [Dictyostelium firmibasis]|uniref:Complex 1 LYR protein domain-containing protein n=1 Tax=Dictyostelium firmibasis TaxID=79012 RepID=A0AAN7U2I9_9MYCE